MRLKKKSKRRRSRKNRTKRRGGGNEGQNDVPVAQVVAEPVKDSQVVHAEAVLNNDSIDSSVQKYLENHRQQFTCKCSNDK